MSACVRFSNPAQERVSGLATTLRCRLAADAGFAGVGSRRSREPTSRSKSSWLREAEPDFEREVEAAGIEPASEVAP
jgi:hypothetical protein